MKKIFFVMSLASLATVAPGGVLQHKVQPLHGNGRWTIAAVCQDYTAIKQMVCLFDALWIKNQQNDNKG